MANWKLIPGLLKRISVGSVTNVWGVDSANNVVRYTGDDAHPWVQIPGVSTGHFSDIGAAADGTVWGVDSSGEIYRYTWDKNHWFHSPNFPNPGAVTRVSVGSDTYVLTVNSNGDVFLYPPPGWLQTNKVPGSHFSDIGAAADLTAWGVDSTGKVFRYIPDANSWVQMPGSLTAISVGSRTNVWGINSADPKEIYWYTGDDAHPWVQIPGVSTGRFSDIGAAADGTVWGIDSSGKIYRYIRS